MYACAGDAPRECVAADSLDAALNVRVERVRLLQQLIVAGARRNERRPDRLAVADEEREGLAICVKPTRQPELIDSRMAYSSATCTTMNSTGDRVPAELRTRAG